MLLMQPVGEWGAASCQSREICLVSASSRTPGQSSLPASLPLSAPKGAVFFVSFCGHGLRLFQAPLVECFLVLAQSACHTLHELGRLARGRRPGWCPAALESPPNRRLYSDYSWHNSGLGLSIQRASPWRHPSAVLDPRARPLSFKPPVLRSGGTRLYCGSTTPNIEPKRFGVGCPSTSRTPPDGVQSIHPYPQNPRNGILRNTSWRPAQWLRTRVLISFREILMGPVHVTPSCQTSLHTTSSSVAVADHKISILDVSAHMQTARGSGEGMGLSPPLSKLMTVSPPNTWIVNRLLGLRGRDLEAEAWGHLSISWWFTSEG